MWNRATGRWIDAEKELRMEKACASRPIFMANIPIQIQIIPRDAAVSILYGMSRIEAGNHVKIAKPAP